MDQAPQIGLDENAVQITPGEKIEKRLDALRRRRAGVEQEHVLAVQAARAAAHVVADLANESWGFRVGDNGASRVGDLLWFSPLRRFQKLFFRTPLVHLFILGSEIYHDCYRWPLRERRVFERWSRETEWGALFARYGGGPLAEAGNAPGAGLSESGSADLR